MRLQKATPSKSTKDTVVRKYHHYYCCYAVINEYNVIKHNFQHCFAHLKAKKGLAWMVSE